MKNNYVIVLSDDAENDFNEAFQYYFKVSPKTADLFLVQVDSSFIVISKTPYLYPEIF